MATTSQLSLRGGSSARDHLFYSSMAAGMALLVLVGFAPSYYLKLIRGEPMSTDSGPLTPLIHVHGALFSSWVALFLVQTGLVAKHRVALHRKLGIAGIALAVAMVIAGVATALQAAARRSSVPEPDPFPFLTIPLFDMLLFSIFVGMGFWKRRNGEAHKRLMMLAYFSILTAAIGRLPGVPSLGPPAFIGITLIVLLIAVAYDWVSRGRVHPVYIWGGTFLAASFPVRIAISETAAWNSFARSLIR